jgi:hypothetical protein
LIKRDVEGHEAALEGAAGTIERDRPAFCVEVTGDPTRPAHPAFGSSSAWVAWAMSLTGSALAVSSVVARATAVNYFPLTDAHRIRLAARGLQAA